MRLEEPWAIMQERTRAEAEGTEPSMGSVIVGVYVYD